MAKFTIDPPVFGPGDQVSFTAAPSPRATFTWLFGDGTQATGRKVRHRFADADGSDLDGVNGAGRFRVFLKAVDKDDRQDWAAQAVVAVARWHNPKDSVGLLVPGLVWHVYPGAWTELPDLSAQSAMFEGESPNLYEDSHGFTRYAMAWDGLIDIPADGGYTFHVMARDGARLMIDGGDVAKTGPPFALVCGLPGNAMRYDKGSIGLRAGRHVFRLEGLHFASQGEPRVLWEGPGLPLTDVPTVAYQHVRTDALTR